MSHILKSVVLDVRCKLRASGDLTKAHGVHMLAEYGAWDMFGKSIGNVVGSWNFNQCKIFGTKPVLYPKIGGGEMADFAKSASPANPHRRRRVRLDDDVPRET